MCPPPPSLEDHVAAVRAFNRTYTRRVGVLGESFLGTGRAFGPARLLFEVGAEQPVTIRALRERLDLDSGYLSRLLGSLEAEGLVVVGPDPDDGRRRLVRLTREGRRARAELDDASQAAARRLVEPLGERQRARLHDALATAELLVRAATVDLGDIDPDAPVARRAVAAYVAELDARFPGGFDPGTPSAADLEELRPPAGGFVVATSDGRPVACGGVRTHAAGTAEVKRMWVDAGWRGAGLGARLLARLEELARGLGHTRVVLDTHGSLAEARTLYARAGYVEVPRYNENPYAQLFFAKEL